MLIFKMVLILIKNKSLDPYSALFLDTPYILETLSFVLKGSIQRILQELLQEYIPPLRIVLFRIPLDLLQEYILPLYSKGIVFKGFLWSCYENISYLCTPREQFSKDSSVTKIYPSFVLPGNRIQDSSGAVTRIYVIIKGYCIQWIPLKKLHEYTPYLCIPRVHLTFVLQGNNIQRIPLKLLQEYILPLHSKGIEFKRFLRSCNKLQNTFQIFCRRHLEHMLSSKYSIKG